jgi:DNA-directed DNA polymerase III PolC
MTVRVRTGYSFKTAIGHLPDVMKRVQEIGLEAAPITDRLSTFGFNRWTKLAKAAGLKPIYGVEIPVVAELGAAKPIVDVWTFLAMDALRPLHEALGLATSNPGREPSLTMTQALRTEGLIKIAGSNFLIDQFPAELEDETFFVALSPSTPKGLLRRAVKAGFNLVAASENFYPNAADKELYRVALGRRSATQTYPMHLLTDDEHKAALAFVASEEEIEEALFNRGAIFAACNAEMKKARLLVPEKPLSLRAMCEQGAQTKSVDLNDDIYKARLERELELIKEKDFEDYFYILSDTIRWAKKRMVVGPARGSSCGSLVCYLLDITEIDPIPYNLIFERFIDINRTDLPDIDVDFSDVNRNKVFEYVEARYGKDRVARLGTVGTFGSRAAVNEAGKSLRIPAWRTAKVMDSIIERSSGDARAMLTLEDTLNETEAGRLLLTEHPEIRIAARMEGHPRNAGQHAAGVLITEDPIAEYVAVDSRTNGAMADKKDSEDLNLLKIDALGLTQLSVFERTLELIGEKPISGWLEKIPLHDTAAFKVLNDRKYSGIFQFTGTSMRTLSSQIEFTGLEDIIAMTALARPGPLGSGGTTSWIKRKNGVEAVSTAHPMLTELTKETFGIVIYQETVMRIVREMGKMSWEDTSAIRKAMSGRLGDEFFAKFWIKFRDGAKENGVEEAVAKGIWEQVNTFGSWSFNRSHAVAYGIVSYWCCWLKAHHPLEFAAATLDAQNDPAKQIAVLRELAVEGIDYVPVDVEHSSDRWTPVKKGNQQFLVGPLTAIKGIGPATVREVMDARRAGSALRPAILKRLQNAQTEIDSLFPIADKIKALHPDLTKLNIFSDPTPIFQVQPGVRGEVMIFALIKKIAPRDENESINVQKRGYALKGPTNALNMFFMDDTEEIFCKIDRFNFERWGKKVIEEGKAGKSLYAVKGTVPSYFRMIKVSAIRYLGEL